MPDNRTRPLRGLARRKRYGFRRILPRALLMHEEVKHERIMVRKVFHMPACRDPELVRLHARRIIEYMIQPHRPGGLVEGRAVVRTVRATHREAVPARARILAGRCLLPAPPSKPVQLRDGGGRAPGVQIAAAHYRRRVPFRRRRQFEMKPSCVLHAYVVVALAVGAPPEVRGKRQDPFARIHILDGHPNRTL